MNKTNLIIGKISSGKTKGIMFKEMNNLIKNNENIIVVDNKEEYYNNFMSELKSNGYNTYVVNLNDSKKSNGFNPLMLPYKLYKEGKKDLSIKMLQDLALEITKNDKAMDEFWSNSASDYFAGLSMLLFKAGEESVINLGSIQMMLSTIEIKLDEFKTYVNNLDLISPEYILLSGTTLAPMETRGGIVSTLKVALNKYVASVDLLNMLCVNELDIINLKEKTAIFILGSANYDRITNILLNELILMDSLKFNYILDNVDSLPKIHELDKLLESNNNVYLVSRNIDYLIETYGKFITDKFENIMEVTEEVEIKETNTYNEYPTLEQNNNKYFNIVDYLNSIN